MQILPSIFYKHLLYPKHTDALERNGDYHFPIFFLLFISCALVIYIYLRYYKKTAQFFSAVFSYGASQQIQRDGHSFFRSYSVSLFLIYMICGGIFFTDLSTYFGWIKHTSSDIVTLISILIVGLLILFKRGINNFFSLITKEKNASEDYFFQYSTNIYAGAFILLGFCLLLRYSILPATYLLPITLLCLGSLFVLRMIKILVFGYSVYGFSLFHLVLYLCGIEIIPLAVFVKIILNS